MGLYEYYDGHDAAAERASIYAAAGAPTDLSLKRQTLLWALNDLKLQDFFYPMRSVAASDRAGADLAWTFYQENFEVRPGTSSVYSVYTVCPWCAWCFVR